MELLLATAFFAWTALGDPKPVTATATTTTLPPECLDDEDCDDGDECTDDTCDDNGDCQFMPVLVDEQASCVIDNIRDIQSEPPALACAGACRCASLTPLLDRADRLIMHRST